MCSDQCPCSSSSSSASAAPAAPAPAASNSAQQNFSQTEIEYFESMVQMMKWTEEWIKSMREKVENSPSEFQFVSETQLMDQYFQNDSNGNSFPILHYLNCLRIPPSLKEKK